MAISSTTNSAFESLHSHFFSVAARVLSESTAAESSTSGTESAVSHAESASAETASLVYTPTYFIATVLLAIVAVSLVFEWAIHYLGKWLVKKKKKAIAHVLHKIKDELMLLGFISILLSIFGPMIGNRCVAKSEVNTFMMCPFPATELSHLSPSEAHAPELSPGHELFPPPPHGTFPEGTPPGESSPSPPPPDASHHARRLLGLPPYMHLPGNEGSHLLANGYSGMGPVGSGAASGARRTLLSTIAGSVEAGQGAAHAVFRRILSGGEAVSCPEGMQPYITAEGLHQLHIFIFLIAVVHIMYSWATVFIALLKLHMWKKWEEVANAYCAKMSQHALVRAIGMSIGHGSSSPFITRHLYFALMFLPSAIPDMGADDSSVSRHALPSGTDDAHLPDAGTADVDRPNDDDDDSDEEDGLVTKMKSIRSRVQGSGIVSPMACVNADEGKKISTGGSSRSGRLGAVLHAVPGGGMFGSSEAAALAALGAMSAKKTVEKRSNGWARAVSVVRKANNGTEVEGGVTDESDEQEGGKKASLWGKVAAGLKVDKAQGGVRVEGKEENGEVGRELKKGPNSSGDDSRKNDDDFEFEIEDEEFEEEIMEDMDQEERERERKRERNEKKEGGENTGQGKIVSEARTTPVDGSDVPTRSNDNRSGTGLSEANKPRMSVAFSLLLTMSSFVESLYNSVSAVDYMTLRFVFIGNHHLSPTYNFHAFLLRAIEHDFAKVVGARWYMWVLVVIAMVFDVYPWSEIFYLSLIPLVMNVAIGTKLEYVMGQLAFEAAHMDDSHINNMKNLKPRDSFFWFHRSKLLLNLVDLILFVNSYILAYVLFVIWQFGWDNCVGSRYPLWQIIVSFIINVISQVLMSFVTLPLYAIVTHMSSDPKAAIFTDEVFDRLLVWRKKHASETVLEGSSAALTGLSKIGGKALQGVKVLIPSSKSATSDGTGGGSDSKK